MRPMKRAVHIDFHTMPGIYDFGREWDAAAFARTLRDADVGYINAFARCNLGFAYYPTQAGIPYPGMKGDMFGDLLRECHQLDIGVSAYINVGLDHEHASRRVDWLRLDSEGRVIRGDRLDNFFRTLCYNNPDYRAYHFAMLREICAYEPDGYFFDCINVQPCYCRHCLEKMKGLGINPDDVAANLAFQQQSIVDFCRESQDIIGDGKYLYLNGLHYVVAQDMDTHIEIECLPSSWSYDYFWPNASYARNLKDTVLYMTGRFQTGWGDFGGFKTRESLEHDYYDALSAGVGVSVGDHMHPARGLEPSVYRTIGEMNRWIHQLEPYTQGTKFIADIGVAVNATRLIDANYSGWGVLDESHSGLARMLGELRQSYDIVNEDMDWSRFRVMILPDRLRMTDGMRDKIAGYLAGGGRVLSSGTAPLMDDSSGFALPEWDFTFDGVDRGGSGYFHMVDFSDPRVCDMDYCAYSQNDTLFTGGRVLANRVKAYFDLHWDGFHGYYYTPPERPDGHAAAALSDNGRVCHIGFEVFRAYNKSASYTHKALVSQCLALLLPDPLIRTQGVPSTARVTATGCDRYTLLHVKVTHPEPRGAMDIIEEHGVLEAGAVVDIRGRYGSARVLPQGDPIPLEPGPAGSTRVRLPRIVGYAMIQLMK